MEGPPGTAADTRPHELLLPAPDRHLANRSSPHDQGCAMTNFGRQHDPRPPDMLLRAGARSHDQLEAGPAGGTDFDDEPFVHAPSLLDRHAGNTPNGTGRSDLIH